MIRISKAIGRLKTYRMIFSIGDLASYDESRACWVLEPGDYVLRLGRNSADTEHVAVLRLDREVITRQCKNALGTPDFKDWKPDRKP